MQVSLKGLLNLLVITAVQGIAYSHQVGPLGEQTLSWRTEQIARVVSRWAPSKVVSVHGKSCVSGSLLSFDVRDDFAFDIDEDVQLQIVVVPQKVAATVSVVYGRNGPGSNVETVELPASPPERDWSEAHVTLKRARFANTEVSGTDLTIQSSTALTLCAISLHRSFETRSPDAYGVIHLAVLDERAKLAPALVGIYDESGRLPLPSRDAVSIRRFSDVTPLVSLSGPEPGGNRLWPLKSRDAFYVSGHYESYVPTGTYTIVVSKGPEYRVANRTFRVDANSTTNIRIELARWIDMHLSGWYSGDAHVHYARTDELDDKNLLLVAQAEDLQVINTLQMGNQGNIYYPQHVWRPIHRGSEKYFLVPGQEDPRTGHLGHTLHLNLKDQVRDPLRYFIYSSIFERTRAQGGTVGYAHVRDEGAFDKFDVGARKGLALNVPLGLVDFVEVLEFGYVSTGTWFDYLNLGYKLSPSAGTDYPYHSQLPGAVRSYVNVGTHFTPNAWFAALRQGRTFVTNGPMLDVQANNQPLGSELDLKRGEILNIKATASLNPDIDTLDSLSVIEQGDVIKEMRSGIGASKLTLSADIPIEHGTWFVVQAKGKGGKDHGNTIAVSAPIYVRMDGQKFWKPKAVPSILKRIKGDLEAVMRYEPHNYESWDIDESKDVETWESQKAILADQVKAANAIYDDLLARARDHRSVSGK